MKALRSILCYAIGGLTFKLMALVIIALSMFFKQERIDPLIKRLCRIFIRSVGIRVTVEGGSQLHTGHRYLLYANHVNIFDPFLLEAYVPIFFRGVELASHFGWPLYGRMIRRIGNIPIERDRPLRAAKTLRKAVEVLKTRHSLMMFPEGHRTLDGKLQRFKRGPFVVAKEAEVPIVPVAQIGSFQVKRKGHWLIQPGPVRLRIGEPIPAAVVTRLSVDELRDLAREKMLDLLGESGRPEGGGARTNVRIDAGQSEDVRE
jgi:1-acyl-sn-glycerol-3-phosphate acyltransferase